MANIKICIRDYHLDKLGNGQIYLQTFINRESFRRGIGENGITVRVEPKFFDKELQIILPKSKEKKDIKEAEQLNVIIRLAVDRANRIFQKYLLAEILSRPKIGLH